MSLIDPQSLARLSMTVNAGAYTLTLGVKQPFNINLPDASNPGSYIEKRVTAPASVIAGYGHASPNFNLGSMGQTLANDWLSNFPIFWYMTIFGGTTYFVASRNPCMKVMPAAAQIGHFGAAPSGTHAQGDAFVAATITTSDFAGLPVFGPIGSMPIQRAATRTSETLVALTAGQDGFGKFQEGVQFTFPEGQNGATAGSYFSKNGAATSLDFASMVYKWWQKRDGRVVINFTTGARSASDATAATLFVHTPLASAQAVNPFSAVFYCKINNVNGWYAAQMVAAQSYFQIIGEIGASATTYMTVAAVANANDLITGVKFDFQAF